MSVAKHTISVMDGSTAGPTEETLIGYQFNVANAAGGGAGQSVTTTVTFTGEALPAVSASQTATFSGNPTANDTLTITGTVVTFVASGASGNQVKFKGIEADDELNLAKVYEIEYRNNAVTPNDYREQRGKKPMDGPWGDQTQADVDIAIAKAKGKPPTPPKGN